ncbi:MULTISPECIES: hypothetical protein [Nocardiopsis]|uniref:hypothetical protein n=1 Tax=Nocardiopsis TaxID=2013 RepID=UPI00034DA60B|nr:MULTISPECIES: hypothetical protein [Nocardiopsis]PWV55458.1 hypothetical protein BDW27_103462 [Nocardiopsis sp. L17-MgMaSL7]
MNRKTVTRIAFAAVIAPALAFGAPAVAMADTFYGAGGSYAGPKGAGQGGVFSAAKSGHGHGHGHDHDHKGPSTIYIKGFETAGPWGAAQGGVISGTN